MMQLDFKLHYKDKQWLCENNRLTFKAKELEEIDMLIKDYLIKTYKKGDFKINFYFDFEAFPLWMRQYMPHYFNRKLTIKI